MVRKLRTQIDVQLIQREEGELLRRLSVVNNKGELGGMSGNKIKVLCVDDSALIRSVMTEIINSQPDMDVVGTAADPLVARDLIKQTNPDVLTLDVEMPRMDGLDFLEKLMRLRPMPVVMVSSLTERGSEITLRALELGAVDFVTKPQPRRARRAARTTPSCITDKIRAAAGARLLPTPACERAAARGGARAGAARCAARCSRPRS